MRDPMAIFHRAPRAFLVCILMMGASCATMEGRDAAWHAATPMIEARAAHAVAANDRYIVAAAGTDAKGRPVRSVERFDGREWKIVAPLPPGLEGGLNAPAAAILGNTLHLTGGFSATSNRPVVDHWALDLSSLQWKRMTPMPAARGGHAMVAFENHLHVVGGGNDQRTLSDHLAWNAQSNTWTAWAPLPRSKGSPAAAIVRGQLVVLGGRSGREDFGDVQRYDQPNNAWIALPAVEARGTTGAVAHCGRVWLIGGESQRESRVLGRVESIDEPALLASGPWQRAHDLPTPRAFARSVVFDGRIHVVGGAVAYGASHEAIGTATVELLDLRC
ncbi:MAG: hypothetical protein JNJ55_04840 [Betaproteobacteria bacterium]|nr:hypothetical protein [Betaproteobacteria bacterium]